MSAPDHIYFSLSKEHSKDFLSKHDELKWSYAIDDNSEAMQHIYNRNFHFRPHRIAKYDDFLIAEWRHPNDNTSTIHFKGSIHKYGSSSGKNNKNMSYKNLLKSLDKLEQWLELPLELCTVVNMEYGVNTDVKHLKATDIVSNCIFHYGRKQKFFSKVAKIRRGLCFMCEYANYCIKIYTKDLQSGNRRDLVFRLEIKTSDSRTTQKQFGVYVLNDLRDPEVLTNMDKKLDKIINELYFYDVNHNGEIPITYNTEGYFSTRSTELNTKNSRRFLFKLINGRIKMLHDHKSNIIKKALRNAISNKRLNV